MIIQRLKEYIDFKGISISMFERNIGMSNASFGKSLKSGGSIGCDKLENILRVYTDINEIWLLYGSGSMIKAQNNIVEDKENHYNTMNTECNRCTEKERLINLLENQLSTRNNEIERLHKIISDLTRHCSVDQKEKKIR